MSLLFCPFRPLMKSPIPLNRYDDFLDDQPVPLNSHASSHRDRTPEPKIVARGLYNFVAQNSRYSSLDHATRNCTQISVIAENFRSRRATSSSYAVRSTRTGTKVNTTP